MVERCLHCGLSFKGLRIHFSRSRQCATAYYDADISNSVNPPIPATVNTATVPSRATAADATDLPDSAYPNRLRTRSRHLNYSESTRRVAPRIDENDVFPTPDADLGDFISTFFDNDQQEPPSPAPNSAPTNPDSQNAQDMLELAVDSWTSRYDSPDAEYNSVAAVAALPSNDEPPAAERPTVTATPLLGTLRTVTMQEQNSFIVVNPPDRSMARIYRLLDSAGSPRYLGDAIIRQIRSETLLNHFDPCDPSITLREAFMHRASKSIGSSPPEAIPVTLETGQKVTVYRFPFLQFYQAHLLSAAFSDIRNLSVDATDPWGGYVSDAATLKDMHDGRWYQASYTNFCEQTPNHAQHVFNPLLQYGDKTGLDGIMKSSLEPMMWISSMLRQSMREDSSNWFPAGFIPNLSMISSAARRGKKGRKYTRSAGVRDYHRCLEVLMQPLKDLQRNPPAMYHRRGDQIKYMYTSSPFLGLVGDNLNNDTATGRMGDYGSTTPRLCRRCLTEFARGGDSVHVCVPVCATTIEYLSMAALGCTYGIHRLPDSTEAVETGRYLRFATIPISEQFEHWVAFLNNIPTKTTRRKYIRLRNMRQKICDLILHKVYGSHVVDNAYFGLDCGSNQNGIFRASLTDILHTIQEGLVPKLLKVFYGLMGDKQRAEIDELVHYLFCEGHNRSGERHLYPRVSFTRGYTQLTMLSADERVGQLFVLSLLLQIKAGREVLTPRFAIDFDTQRNKAKDKFEKANSEASVATPEQSSDEEVSDVDDGSGEPDDASDDASAEAEGSDEDLDVESNSQCSDDGHLSENQIKLALDNLDLSHVLDGIRPFLDDFHKRRLDNVLATVLTASALEAVAQVTLPQNLTNYRTVPVAIPDAVDIETDEGLILPGFEVDEDREDNSIKLPMDKFIYLVETVLSLHAFLKYGCALLVSSPTGITEYQRALELFLRVLVATVDRGEDSNQWRLQKMLELVHFLEDVLDYGPASGFSTETGERGLKQWAKAPAKTAQNRSDEIFSRQVCLRIHERVLINGIADAHPLEEPESEDEVVAITDVQVHGANFVVDLHDTASVTRVLSSGKQHKIQIDFPSVIVDWFATHFLEADNEIRIQLYTEIVLPGNEGKPGTRLRAHPNYQSAGAEYDYALVSYDEENRDDRPTYPCKMACFYKDPNTGRIMALVQEVEFQTPKESSRESQLYKHWTLRSRENRTSRRRDAVLNAIPVESLSDRIYAIDPKPVGGFSRTEAVDFEILVVKYVREQWPASFLESHKYLTETYTWD